MELILTRPDATVSQVTVTCDGQTSHTFDLFALSPTKGKGLLHPTAHWTSATAGTAVLALPRTTRLGRSLITGVCDTAYAPAEETVWVR